MQMKCKNMKKFALCCANCCIVQSVGKEACVEVIQEKIVVQKLQIGKR